MQIVSLHDPTHIVLELPGDRLEGARIERQVLRAPNFRNLALTGMTFVDVLFVGGDFSGTNWLGSDLLNCKWLACNFAAATISSCNLQSCAFAGCNILGAKLTNNICIECSVSGPEMGVAWGLSSELVIEVAEASDERIASRINLESILRRSEALYADLRAIYSADDQIVDAMRNVVAACLTKRDRL